VADGLVHFKVTPLDSRGMPVFMEFTNSGVYPELEIASVNAPFQTFLVRCWGATVPAALHLEVGILEPQAVAQWRALPTPVSRARFLTNQAARIHYFQQRVPVRAAPRLMPSEP
jgi:hypothetical protein